MHGGKRWLDVGADISRLQVTWCPGGRGEGALGALGQVVRCEGGIVVCLEEALAQLPQPAGGVGVRTIDVGAVDEGSQAVKLLPGERGASSTDGVRPGESDKGHKDE